jgi:SAM-dependent methyltransferase
LPPDGAQRRGASADFCVDAAMNETAILAIEARLEWRSEHAAHVDHLLVKPSALQADGRWLAAGEALAGMAAVKLDATPWCQPAGQPPIELAPDAFHPRAEMVAGRYYPRLAFGGLLGNARDLRPVRLLAAGSKAACWCVDPNHPLAAADVRLILRHTRQAAAPGMRLVELFDGPGMQVPPADPAGAYFSATDLSRQDSAADAVFYATPRLTQHLDAQCRTDIATLYGRLLQPGMKVLDLMASGDSHLPETPGGLQVSGLGMNQAELAANPRLSARLVQDLNATTALPWPDCSFDCVLCTAAIEYLVRPASILDEVKRILRPGGVFAISFSDRWFPPKAIRVWSALHPFERMGLVLSLLRLAGFDDLHTESRRGAKRPDDDKYIGRRGFADPLFAVWGRRGKPRR